MDESEYQPGESAFYHEAGNVYRVRVRKNNSDNKLIKYSLRVMDVTRYNKTGVAAEAGDVIDCKKNRSEKSPIWRLLDE